MFRAADSVAMVLVLVSTVRGAAAAATPIDLEWDAPAECPTSAAVSSEIETVLARASTTASRLAVLARVSHGADEKWRVELVLRGAGWEARRALEGPTCGAVAEAAALVVALATEPPIEPTPAPEPDHVAPESPASAPPTFAGPFIGVGAAVDVGALPAATMGIEATMGWRIGHARVELGGSYFGERSESLPDRDDTGATFHLASVNARACYEFDRGAVAFGPCADAGIIWTKAQGFGPISPIKVSSTTPAIGADFGAKWHLTRFFVPYARIGGALPTWRPEYAVQGMGPIHRASAGAFRGSIGIELQF